MRSRTERGGFQRALKIALYLPSSLAEYQAKLRHMAYESYVAWDYLRANGTLEDVKAFSQSSAGYTA